MVGPTASGKTALAIELAKQFDGEVISCDSMQVYREMNIGTAKPSEEEMDGVKHHMLDFADPKEVYTCADYVRDAKDAIAKIVSNGGRGISLSLNTDGKFVDVFTDKYLKNGLQSEVAGKSEK